MVSGVLRKVPSLGRPKPVMEKGLVTTALITNQGEEIVDFDSRRWPIDAF